MAIEEEIRYETVRIPVPKAVPSAIPTAVERRPPAAAVTGEMGIPTLIPTLKSLYKDIEAHQEDIEKIETKLKSAAETITPLAKEALHKSIEGYKRLLGHLKGGVEHELERHRKEKFAKEYVELRKVIK